MSSSIVGLDLGSSGLRAVQLGRKGRSGDWEISRAASVELDPGVLRNGAVLEQRAFVAALKGLWRRGRFTTRRAAFSLNDSSVLTRQVELPWMPPADFAAALRFQLGDALPVDLASVELDYHLLAESTAADEVGNVSAMNQILVVAANREVVEAQGQALRKARIEPMRADSGAFALIRAACSGRLPMNHEVRAIADIGADQLTVVIHEGGQPLFIRTIANLGGNNATQALVDRLDLDWSTAERLKRETGLNGPAPVVAPVAESSVFGSGRPDAPPDPRVLATIGVLNPWATTIVNEIRNSLDYYQASHPVRPVSALDLAGRTVLLDGLRERIATQLPVPVQPIDPLAGLTPSSRVRKAGVPDSRLAVAIGMALGAAE